MRLCSFVLPLVLLLLSSGRRNSCVAKPPNIVFILSDDLGYGDVSISPLVNRSHEIPTPNIQRLADEGMRFLRGYSGQVCAPSRCTLMTGRHSGHCTVRGNDGSYTPLLKSDVTVARALGEQYVTGIVGKWGLGDFNTTGYPLEQGFQHYIGQASQVACHDWYPKTMQNNTLGDWAVQGNSNASNANCGDHHSKCTWANDLFNREAIRFIRENGQPAAEKPFFLFFSTTTPHTGFLAGDKSQWAVPAPYDTRFDLPEAQAAFAQATSAQDDFVGAVLDELKALDIDDETVVFFSGDNGPDSHSFGYFDDPGPFRGKKRSLHEGGIRQTIVARWPGHVAANSTTDHLFAFWDFLPTAAELGGVDVPDGVDGISAAATLRGTTGQKTHDFLYWEFCDYGRADGLLPQLYAPGWVQAMRYDELDASGVRTEWKGIRSNRGDLLLYNLTEDISESSDVSDKYAIVALHIGTMMEAAHTETPFWKSSHNATDRCCASCFNHNGCKAPCVLRHSSQDDRQDLSPPLLYLSPYHLLGDWDTEKGSDGFKDNDVGEDFRVHLDAERMKMFIDHPRDRCLHLATVDLQPDDAQSMQTVTLTPRLQSGDACDAMASWSGTLHTDGNSLYVKWQVTSDDDDNGSDIGAMMWRKPGFDYD